MGVYDRPVRVRHPAVDERAGTHRRRRYARTMPRFVVGLVLLLALAACTPDRDQPSAAAPVAAADGPVSSELEAANSVVAASTVDDPPSESSPDSTASQAPDPQEPVASRGEPEPAPPVALPGPLQAQIEGLMATVESIRGLEFLDPPTIRALTPDEVVTRRATSLAADLAGVDFAPEEALYTLLGVFPGRVDLESFYTDFYSTSTIAYYDLDDHELVIPISGELLSPYEQWIMVHELTHALVDQRFPNATAEYVRLGESDQIDAAGGLLGLIEGEAVLVQSLFYETLDSDERAELREQADARRNDTFAAAPAFFRAFSRFPYTDGSLYALYLYQRGGMDALDRAYEQPPRTTEEVYAPEAYVEGIEAIEPGLRVDAPFGFSVVERGTWGARGWRTLFGQFLNGGSAAEAAEGWGGDDYALLWNPETHQIAFVALFVGDSVRDASEFGGAIEDFVSAAMDVEVRFSRLRTTRFTGADHAYVERIEDRVLFVAASDAVTAAAVQRSVRGFR